MHGSLSPTPLDRQLAARTAAATLLLAAVALLIMAQTDEASLAWADRLARLAALAPALGALGAALQRPPLARRGDLRALHLAGASPLRLGLGPALGAALVGLPVALVLALRAPSLRALLPLLDPSPWRAVGAGFEAPALGVRLGSAGGAVEFVGAQTIQLTGPPRGALAAALAVAAVVAPLWAAVPCGGRARGVLGTGAVLGAIVAFHAMAQGGSPWWLLAPSVLLLGHLAATTRGASRGVVA